MLGLISRLLPTLVTVAQGGEPIYEIPPEERQPELTVRADLLDTVLAENRDWGHTPLGLADLHAKGVTGAGTLVAILDTGIDYRHPDLEPQMLAGGPHRDFTNSTSGYMDRQGHGTHCAGIAAAAANGSGIIGAAPGAKLLAVKVLSDQGSGASSWIAAGIRHAADAGADVISLSLGGPSPDPQTRAAVQYATGKGCWVVIAAGNDGRPADSYPGHYPESCAVAAIGRDLTRAPFSTINPENDVAAPGVSIWSTLPDGRYGSMSGTSMATPYVAGCLALVRGELKRRRASVPLQGDLLAAIKGTAKDLPPAGRDTGTGAGLIDVVALRNALVPDGPPPPPPGERSRCTLEYDEATNKFSIVG